MSKNRLVSLSSSIKDYIEYALKHDAVSEIIDPAGDEYWDVYKKLALQDEALRIKENVDTIKADRLKEVMYA